MNKILYMPRETRDGLYQGVIEKDSNGNYFCGPLLLDYQLVQSSFKLGDRISVKKVIGNTSAKSSKEYPQKAIKFSLAVADHNS